MERSSQTGPEKRATKYGVIAGILVTPAAILLAIESTGAGHGNYLAAKVLFPITMLSALILKSITPPFMLLAFVQFPLYGWMIGAGIREGRSRYTWIPIAFHVASVALNFLIPNFS